MTPGNFAVCVASLVLIIISSGCEPEDEPQRAPSVQTLSATMQSDGINVLVKARLISDGNIPMTFVDICSDSVPEVDITDNPRDAYDVSGDIYSAVIPGPEAGKTLYVRAVAANSAGKAGGNTIACTMEKPAAPAVPCSLGVNVLKYNGFTHPNGSSSMYIENNGFYSGWLYVECSWYYASGPTIRIHFNRPRLTSGVYYTGADSDSKDPNLVSFRIHQGQYYYPLDGEKLFVTENADGSFNVQFCDMKYEMFSSPFLMSGNIRVVK